ncbi:MAG: cadmium-translocating P-type ATPase [Lachnospiraceae bacterium]|nr:cadmium-translocating P-type ATPase [Lachnospiraceae bacterium]MCI1656179.1 cadmium-translocating P-type ATPase [Lachnospiraceae bacterium]MCI2194661.1 cadmium-translocating P-type ATPase [Lachnospiraceae bacterium]
MTKKQKRELKRILTAAGIFFALLILARISEASGWAELFFRNRWVMLGCYLVPFLIVGWPVVRGAAHGIANGQVFDEEFLMTLAAIGAFATGENAEAAAVMLFYQVGEFFQSYAVNKSRRSIRELMDIAPAEAVRERFDGTTEVIDPSQVEIGDILLIRPGEKVPVDGRVTEGSSLVDTAALTGEPVPRSVKPGDTIISGCINGDGLLRVCAEKKYADSTVARILELVENASARKSRTENFITRFARYYTPVVVLAAVVLAFVPPIFAGNLLQWIYRACTFLVISCPCALVISVPMAFFGGIGAASGMGILVKGSNFLEQMAHLDTIVTDKTGTLTRGEFRVTRVIAADGTEQEVLRTAAAAECGSTHPIAASICAVCEAEEGETALSAVENISGKGIRAVIDGAEILVGSEKLLEERGIPVPVVDSGAATVVHVARNGRYMGTILISDTVKPEAAEAIRELKQEGVGNVVMLTGDRKETGEAVGRTLGLDHVYTELLPGDKVRQVEALLAQQNDRQTLAFVGDGTNDAPVLSRADIGIAMGVMGSDAAIEAADIVIMDDDLLRLPVVVRIARRTLFIAKQNIVFALAVKILILILGAFGLANMWAAVFADVGVAIICILNAMRTLAKRRYRSRTEEKGSR